MKKLLTALFLFGLIGSLKAEDHQLTPQFRVWKSSFLGGNTLTTVQLSSCPCIFHTIISSGVVNGTGSNYFAVLRSTTDNFVAVSTKAFIPLNQSNVESPMAGYEYNIFSDSHTYYTKAGNSVVTILYDINTSGPCWNPFPKD